MHGCWGACMVAGGHAWLPGGMHSCWGACVIARGACVVMGVCMVAGGCAWLQRACVVVGASVVEGGMRGCGGACIWYNKIQSMSGWYTSYSNAFLSMSYYTIHMYISNEIWANGHIFHFWITNGSNMGKNIWKFWPLSSPKSTSFTSIKLSPKKQPTVDSPTKWEFLSELASQLVWTNLRTVGKTEWTVFSNGNT